MAFLGMRGNGDWVTNQRPESWRETMLYLYPNGQLPLTAILSKMGSEAVTDPTFHWWTKTQPNQSATITGVYTDAALSSAYTSGGVAGQIIYVKCSAAHAAEFRAGHQVLFKDTDDPYTDITGKVIANPTINGASSSIPVKLLEADTVAGVRTHDISDANSLLIIGSINPEGGEMPDSVAYDPIELHNYTQIFRTSLAITRTARKTRLRTGDQLKEAKREALELHGVEMERAFLFGQRTSGTGSNGKPERTTWGLVPMLRSSVAANVDDYRLSTNYAGQTWLQGGEHWLDTYLEQIFRYGSQEKLGLCGNSVILAISRLIKNGCDMTITPGETVSYGIKVANWITPFGTLYLKTHPLLNLETSLRDMLIITEPSYLKYRYIDDTQFIDQSQTSTIDGTEQEFLTEAGLEFHHPQAMGVLSGFGSDS